MSEIRECFSSRKITDVKKAIEWIRTGFENAAVSDEFTLYDIFSPEIMEELEKYIHQDTLQLIHVSSIFDFGGGLNEEEVIAEIKEAIKANEGPLSFSEINEVVVNAFFRPMSQSFWNRIKKNFKKIGDKANAVWDIRE